MPSISLSVTTLCEIALVGTFIGALVFVSLKSPSSASSTTGDAVNGAKAKGKKKKKATKSVVPEKEAEVIQHVETNSKEVGKADARAKKVVEKKEKAEKKVMEKEETKREKMEEKAERKDKKETTSASFASVASAASASTTPSLPTIAKSKKEAKRDAKKLTETSDMRDFDLDPEITVPRVMKIVEEKSLAPSAEWLAWSAAEDEREAREAREVEEDSWVVAKPKKPVTVSLKIGSSASAFNNSNPAPKSIPGLGASNSAALTKKQRENSKRSDRVAAEKAEVEREREQRLAEYRKGAEKSRSDAAAKAAKPKPRSENRTTTATSTSRPKEQSGGMSSSLDSNSNLIWE